jgi:hypothetical protein
MMVGSAVEYNIYQQFQIKKWTRDNFNQQFQIKNGLSGKSNNEDVKHKLEEEKDST